MGLLGWLFKKAKVNKRYDLYRASNVTVARSFKLVSANFAPDDDKTDLEWHGFHIHNERGRSVTYQDAVEIGLLVFRVEYASHRMEALQSKTFDPGSELKLIAEDKNPDDSNTVGIWNLTETIMAGYVPKEHNRQIRRAMQGRNRTALALAEHRKDGRRVSLTVLYAPTGILS